MKYNMATRKQMFQLAFVLAKNKVEENLLVCSNIIENLPYLFVCLSLCVTVCLSVSLALYCQNVCVCL